MQLKPLGSILHDGWEKIYEHTVVGSAETAITISDLNGDVDEEYILESKVVNGYNGISTNVMLLNNDSGGNYGFQYVRGINTATNANRGGSQTGISITDHAALGDISIGSVRIFAKSGFVRTAVREMITAISGTTVSSAQLFGNSWNNTADNITSIVLQGGQAGAFGVGSSFTLFRKARRT